jgi:ribonuclease E
MANKMIIDASHPEETRVVVLRGSRVEEFDFESASKRPLRGNIYLAKVTRVEPSLQAAFVDYGGNRHGFLAFSDIHPDYYQIPVADRQALLEEEALSQREEDDEPSGERRSRRHRRPRQPEIEARSSDGEALSEPAPAEDQSPGAEVGALDSARQDDPAERPHEADQPEMPDFAERGEPEANDAGEAPGSEEANASPHVDEREATAVPSSDIASMVQHAEGEANSNEDDEHEVTTLEGGSEERIAPSPKRVAEDEGEPVEQIGGDALEEVPRRPHRLRRQYKIQEVIKRRQVLLVQVVKEERGNKGAALTTYLSLAGRYSVLMPNTARGGGISRKITNAQDRSRLKSIAEELDVPEGMGVILRTAGASRTKAEVKRDFEYLLRMWETVRETTLASSAPTLVYEEGSLIKRAIRDLYSKEVEEIIVAGDTGYREARQFMRLLMPSHVNNVQLYRDTQPVFAKAGVESQLDAMFSNQVTLKSGGYIVINQTEALVAIDVNSGRSTREHNIEDTALRTNLEAADEIARQLRLRNIGGLIIADFIDMKSRRDQQAVYNLMKERLKRDKARTHVLPISQLGLMEMTRQRAQESLSDTIYENCPYCGGRGVVKTTMSTSVELHRTLNTVMRRYQDSIHDIRVILNPDVLKRLKEEDEELLVELERRYAGRLMFRGDPAFHHEKFVITDANTGAELKP